MIESAAMLLAGQPEAIDTVAPQVRAMLANPGFYIGANPMDPEQVPLASVDGKLFSLWIDRELAPESVRPDTIVAGPFHIEDRWLPIERAPKSRVVDGRVEGVYLLGFVPDPDAVDPASQVDVIWWEPLMPNAAGGRGKWLANRFGDACEVKPTWFKPIGPLPPQDGHAHG